MSEKLCPVCGKPYVSMETARNKDRHPGAPPQEWYKHTSERWCTKRLPR